MEVSSSAFTPPTLLGRQDGEEATSGLQKEDRDSVLCRLDKVFKLNGIVNDPGFKEGAVGLNAVVSFFPQWHDSPEPWPS
ncbi:hypothetical protein TNCV_2188261 [Trichonephila clavipes]|nr:hypothetical protein TNCV_2188261 [Trichonephila clavipes]